MPTRKPVRCAFCNGLAKLRHEGGDTYRVAYVECRGCGCRGPMIDFGLSQSLKPHIKAECAAVDGWNLLHAVRNPAPPDA